MNSDELRTDSPFHEEMAAVRDTMLDRVSDIGGPLRELVIARVGQEGPNVYAGIVLCAGFNSAETSAVPRLNLAAALQLLHVALGIHQLLVDATLVQEYTQLEEQDKTFIGSTILAGDYCFSHAAELAASTNNPTIVARFSTALQDVSAMRLRDYLGASANNQPAALQEPDPTLLLSGVAAAFELSDLPTDARSAVEEMAQQLAIAIAIDALPAADASAFVERIDRLPQQYQQRWRALIDLLAANA